MDSNPDMDTTGQMPQQGMDTANGNALNGISSAAATASTEPSNSVPAPDVDFVIKDFPLPSMLVNTEPPTAQNNPSAFETQEEEAEWEMDSSPYQSSDSSSSSSDSEDEDGYHLLTADETARILLAEGGGGSDDESGAKGGKISGSGLRTQHEVQEEVPPTPDIVITPDMNVEILGVVEHIVEDTVLIKAYTSGEYQVLESGSLLCLENREAIGVVADTLGQVQEPLYSVRFTSRQSIDALSIKKGIQIFYVPQHSTFVFTEPLKAIKGSDASNLYDEEVAESEVEYSDDEKEANHKRKMKEARNPRRLDRSKARDAQNPDATSRNSRANMRKRNRDAPPSALSVDAKIQYDDPIEIKEEMYTPLARPANLHELMGQAPPIVEGSSFSLPNRQTHAHSGGSPEGNRGRGGVRGRGRDRERSRGRGRGGFGRGNNGRRGVYAPSQPNQLYNTSPITSPSIISQSPSSSFYSGYQQPSVPPMQQFQSSAASIGYPVSQQQQQQQQQQLYYPPQQLQQQYYYPPSVPSRQSPPPGSFINPAFYGSYQQQQQQNTPSSGLNVQMTSGTDLSALLRQFDARGQR